MNRNHETVSEKTLDFAAGARVFSARVLLQGVRTPAEAIDTIGEVVRDFIGAEEAVIFEVDQQKTALWLHWSCGIDSKNYPFAESIPRPLLERVLAGKSFFRGEQSKEENSNEGLQAADGPNAAIPIWIGNEIVGVLAIFRLRPEKSRLDAPDRRICQSIATCCGRLLARQLA